MSEPKTLQDVDKEWEERRKELREAAKGIPFVCVPSPASVESFFQALVRIKRGETGLIRALPGPEGQVLFVPVQVQDCFNKPLRRVTPEKTEGSGMAFVPDPYGTHVQETIEEDGRVRRVIGRLEMRPTVTPIPPDGGDIHFPGRGIFYKDDTLELNLEKGIHYVYEGDGKVRLVVPDGPDDSEVLDAADAVFSEIAGDEGEVIQYRREDGTAILVDSNGDPARAEDDPCPNPGCSSTLVLTKAHPVPSCAVCGWGR